ncbi:MAG TPA: DNA internalization-related competence protein ComEC/Rec2 [Limnobacter sp.]|nr:DNA internalization-related competence protein ComEC/Rec2 [Limnobacter sp.]
MLAFLQRHPPINMPALAAFTLAHLAGLLVLQQQAKLPNVYTHIHGVLGPWAFWMLCALALAFALSRAGRFWYLLAMCGFAFGHAQSGLQAAHILERRAPLACHKQTLEAQFELQARSLRPDQVEQWLVKHTPRPDSHALCLKPGSMLQLRVEKAAGKSPQAGDVLTLQVQIKALQSTLQLHGFDVHAHWFSQELAALGTLKRMVRHQPAQWPTPLQISERVRWQVGTWLVQTLHTHPEKALMLALVIGDQGLIDPEDRMVYNRTGVAHLVAISGLHITLFAGLAGWCCKRLWRNSARLCSWCPAPRAGAIGGLVFAVLYALVAGWGIPAQRTVFMMLALWWSMQRNARLHGWDVFVLALAICLVTHPWAPMDAGFWLSFVAVGALVYCTHGRLRFTRPRLPWLADAIHAQWAVTVALLLPCAMLFHQQSIISPVANALSIPWMSFVSTPLALLGSLVRSDTLVSWSAHSLSFQKLWLEPMAALPWASVLVQRQPVWVYACAGLGCVLLLSPGGLKLRRVGAVLLCLLAWPAPRPTHGDFWLTAMDVGQGTALAIQTQHHVLLYDTGPALNPRADSGLRVVLPWLHAQGYAAPDALWLSHQDADHAGGAPFLMRHATPAMLASPMQVDHPLRTLANQLAIAHQDCHTMAPWVWDGVLFTPLNNTPPAHAGKAAFKTNNQSCVLKISNGQHTVLLAGDIEQSAEAQLIARHGSAGLQADMLLVPHHGSRTSSSWPLLAAVRPSSALIQSGWRNAYGHPHPQVVARYASQGIHMFNTAQLGALHFAFEQTNPEIRWLAAHQTRKRLWHMHEIGAD